MEKERDIIRAIRLEFERAGRLREMGGDPRMVPGPQNRMRKVSLRHPDAWDKKLFIAKCKSFGINAFRHPSDPPLTNHVDVPELFFKELLWPEFQAHMNFVSEQLNLLMESVVGEDGPWQDELEIPA